MRISPGHRRTHRAHHRAWVVVVVGIAVVPQGRQVQVVRLTVGAGKSEPVLLAGCRVRGLVDRWRRRRPLHFVRAAAVVGPQLGQRQHFPATRAGSLERGNVLGKVLGPHRLAGVEDGPAEWALWVILLALGQAAAAEGVAAADRDWLLKYLQANGTNKFFRVADHTAGRFKNGKPRHHSDLRSEHWTLLHEDAELVRSKVLILHNSGLIVVV